LPKAAKCAPLILWSGRSRADTDSETSTGCRLKYQLWRERYG
jgi:hypothetical protein